MNEDISSNLDDLALEPAVPPGSARPVWRRRGAVLGAASAVGPRIHHMSQLEA